jgi:hypothetical protein
MATFHRGYPVTTQRVLKRGADKGRACGMELLARPVDILKQRLVYGHLYRLHAKLRLWMFFHRVIHIHMTVNLTRAGG